MRRFLRARFTGQGDALDQALMFSPPAGAIYYDCAFV